MTFDKIKLNVSRVKAKSDINGVKGKNGRVHPINVCS